MSAFDPITVLRLTLSNPRQGLRAVLSLPLTPAERMGLMVTMAILNVLAAQVFARQLPELPNPAMALIMDQPIVFALMQLFGLILLAGLVQGVGRLFGGRGDAAGAQIAVLWLHVLFLILQLAQIITMAVVPPLTPLLSLATLGVALWVFPQFVAEVHGFRSAGLTALGILATVLAIFLLLNLAVALIASPEA